MREYVFRVRIIESLNRLLIWKKRRRHVLVTQRDVLGCRLAGEENHFLPNDAALGVPEKINDFAGEIRVKGDVADAGFLPKLAQCRRPIVLAGLEMALRVIPISAVVEQQIKAPMG